MASQKSRSLPLALAVAPKRDRGRSRVAAILDAGAALFAERGYDATTMSEVAARSTTAIGSLYRFFPTKAALAESLLTAYAAGLAAALDAIEAEAARTTPDAIADALIDLMIAADAKRAAVFALLDGRDDADDRRAALRQRVRAGVGAILRAARPAMAETDAARCAIVTLHLMKTVSVLAAETDGPALIVELRGALRGYLTQILSR